MKRALFIVFSLALIPSIAPAQQSVDRQNEKWNYQGEVFASIGWGRLWHGDDSLGGGLDLGGGFGLRPFSGRLQGLGFELQFSRLHHEAQHTATHSTSGNALTVTGNILYHFGSSRVQPYVAGGIGALRADHVREGYSEWYTGDPDDPDSWTYHVEYWSYRVKGTKMAIKIGGGLKAAITPRMSIRPELCILDTTIGRGYNWSSLKLFVALSYHW